MAQDKMKILNEHAKNYIHAVMADSLRQEGYVSKDEKDLHWYRVINGDVLQAVFFYTHWAALPMFMAIGYSCHPLFITPEYPKNVHMPSMLRSLEAVNPGKQLVKQNGNTVYSPDAAITCPADHFRGADILESILDQLNDIRTVEQCYAVHKQRYRQAAELLNLSREEMYHNLSTDFMDEAVFLDDQELYPYCSACIPKELARYARAQETRKLWNIEKYELNALNHLKEAIIDKKREEHLAYLQERQEINIRQLKRRVKGCIE
ncbi:MAG: hypothetical protein IJA75_10040 [Oscillospiraceae bacterium]|nr:hypothetical protein [Oscillospiraceae bacterium]